MMRKKTIKFFMIIGVFSVFIFCIIAFYKNQTETPETIVLENTEEKDSWWGESGDAFINESEVKVKDPALLDDTDKNWIDVDGLRDIANGKAVLINDTNRDWIGKEVTINATVVHGSEIKEPPKNNSYENTLKEERIKKALDNDYIKKVDSEERYLPVTVNPFFTLQKEDYFETPEVIMGGCAMVIFTKPDGAAWHLKKGETLSFEAEQYELETTKTQNKNQTIKFGYLSNGELHQTTMDEGLYHQYSFTAPQEGDYYITILSASMLLTLKNGKMTIE